ncbi:hypothetical protein SRABI96_03207 [Peribacillus sp. Bi96]|nr:hypothetical protein SRABI96_03207 [Peribacillus sp. Bi96]
MADGCVTIAFCKGTGSKALVEGIERKGEAMVSSKNKVGMAHKFNRADHSTIEMIPISP